ncbi:hypothetical protein BDY19DRAFT_995255 [Irpex rosettiformis]|uniref:Uncharacterized protein n=1 Tax=Irpex rosettiformis TaxID=378272 RepID=A0ACB8TYU8_9APHY|nr:hypothetical protein BDY19DRAFT_995255 [Irpex rosettiformis]
MSALDIPVSYETVVIHGAAVKALAVVGLTALLYDHLLTLGMEVYSVSHSDMTHVKLTEKQMELIWRARMGFVSIVFLLNRYIVPLMLIIDAYELSSVGADSVTFCRVWTATQSLLTLASFMAIHAIVSIRVYALHGGRAWIRRFLWVSGTLYFFSTVAFIVWSGIPVIFHKAGIQPTHHACVGPMPSYIWLVWLPTVIFESLLFLLTLIALLSLDEGQSFSDLTVILYRDGTIYFVAITICSSFCLLVWAFAPETLNGLARYFALATVNIVASRMVLNLKAFAASKRPVVSTSDSPIAFPPTSFFSYAPSTPRAVHSHRSLYRSPPPTSTFDLEMYTIGREYQQLETKLR